VGLRTKLAVHLGVDRSGLYRIGKASKRDENLKVRIEAVLAGHPRYGHRRVALALSIGKNRANRVMKLFGLAAKQRTKNHYHAPTVAVRPAPANLIQELNLIATRPCYLWACDFTYIKCFGRWYYLATVIDLFTREIVGWSLSRHHNADLILGALYDALSQYNPPQYLHFDRGSEYLSGRHMDTCAGLGNYGFSQPQRLTVGKWLPGTLEWDI
jgi:putative transposase